MKKGKEIKTYKAFNADMTCRGFQYEVDKTYTLPEGEKPEMCHNGFHAISDKVSPLEVFRYYAPNDSRYCEVVIGGETVTNGEKVVGSEIHIGDEIGIDELLKAHIEWVKRNIKKKGVTRAIETDKHSSASNTGNFSLASNTGYCSSASNTGAYSLASNTGAYSSASNTGFKSSASNTGAYSLASNTGNCSSAEAGGADSVAIVTGRDSKVRGALGCWLVLTERDDGMHIIGMQCAKVDGKTVKPNTWYQLINGKITEA